MLIFNSLQKEIGHSIRKQRYGKVLEWQFVKRIQLFNSCLNYRISIIGFL